MCDPRVGVGRHLGALVERRPPGQVVGIYPYLERGDHTPQTGQGNCILLIDLVKDTAQVRLIPARFEPLGLDAHLGRLVLPQQVEGDVA